jgi:hypothetical protein
MADVLMTMIVFSVPLSAIIGGFWLKAKKIQATSGPDPQLAYRLAQLEAQNSELRQRVETLETIVTSDKWDARLASRVRVQGTAPAAESFAEPEDAPSAARARR